MIRELRNVLPGRFPNGVDVASGDVNGDNYDDLIVSAGKGHGPIVTAIDGRDLATGVANPATLFTFSPGGGKRSGTRVAVGYVAPSTVPSFQANLITTPESGKHAGMVEVWNPADLGADANNPMGMMMDMAAAPMAASASPAPMAVFRPLGGRSAAVQVTSNYLGNPGSSVIASWQTPHRVAFSTIDMNNQVTTQIHEEGDAAKPSKAGT